MSDLAQQWENAKPASLNDAWDKAAPVDQPSPDRIGAAAAGINRGMAGLAGLPVDTIENIINLGIAAYGTAKQALTGKPGPDLLRRSLGGSERIASSLEGIGLNTKNPSPDDMASRMLYTGGVIAGGGPQNLKSVIPAVSGAIAGEALGPEYVGVGAMSPAAVGMASLSARNAVAARSAPIVDAFKQAGTMPSVGQATDNAFLHGIENLAAKFPGGSGLMQNFIENQQRQMGAKARTGTSAEAAGRAIETGIKGGGGFLDRTKSTWESLDNAVAQKIPQGSASPPANTVQALGELTAVIPGAAKTTGALVNPKIAEIKSNLEADLTANNGQIPFEAIRSVRSKVGSMLDDALVSGVPNGELKKLYGALSKDMEFAANAAGAGREFKRQNDYYRARMDRIESVLDRVIGTGKQPEDIFKTFYPTDPDQANKVRAVMRSLTPLERQTVSEAVANRLGRAAPTKQLEAGDTFSSETFLTNWNKLSPGAKAQLFPEPPMRDNMEKIASAASRIREGKGIYSNPSGTAGSFAAYSIYASPIAAIASGSVAPLAAAGGAAGSAYIGAKMLTNPKVVEWLSKPVSPTRPGDAAAHLARLAVIYDNSKDDALKQEISRFIEMASKQ